jgi:hypothetical protein
VPRPSNIKVLSQLAPGSRTVQQLLPVYKGPKGQATTAPSSPAGRKTYKRNYGYFYDVTTGTYVTKRQRHNAITGWTSYEQQAQARKTYGKSVEAPVVRYNRRLREAEAIQYEEPLPPPPGEYIRATRTPQEEPTVQAVPERPAKWLQRPIEEVVPEMEQAFTVMYTEKRYSEGASDDEISVELGELLPKLDELVLERRRLADNWAEWAFEEQGDNQATWAADDLNEFLEDNLGTNSEDFWSHLYPSRTG